MSITVRLWTKEDLLKICQRPVVDRELTTIFMNTATLNEEESIAYPYDLRHTYLAEWHSEGVTVPFYATDDEMAIWFLQQEYNRLPDKLTEKVVTFRKVKIKEGNR